MPRAFLYAPFTPSFDWPLRRVARRLIANEEGPRMRHLTYAAAIVAIEVLVAACGGNDHGSTASSTITSTTTTTTTTPPRPPVAQAALPNILLSPAEVDGALGTTGATSKKKFDKLSDEDANQP